MALHNVTIVTAFTRTRILVRFIDSGGIEQLQANVRTL